MNASIEALAGRVGSYIPHSAGMGASYQNGLSMRANPERLGAQDFPGVRSPAQQQDAYIPSMPEFPGSDAVPYEPPNMRLPGQAGLEGNNRDVNENRRNQRQDDVRTNDVNEVRRNQGGDDVRANDTNEIRQNQARNEVRANDANEIRQNQARNEVRANDISEIRQNQARNEVRANDVNEISQNQARNEVRANDVNEIRQNQARNEVRANDVNEIGPNPAQTEARAGAGDINTNPGTPGEANPENTNANPDDGPAPGEYTPEEQRAIDSLQARDREVRAHEQAHISAGGAYVRGGATYQYESGPDGKRYAVGGEVSIDASPVRDNPEATIAKMQVVRSAATAPAEPSGQDRAVAAAASRAEAQARAELSEQRAEDARGGNDDGTVNNTNNNAANNEDEQNTAADEQTRQSRVMANAAAAYANNNPYAQAAQPSINFAA